MYIMVQFSSVVITLINDVREGIKSSLGILP